MGTATDFSRALYKFFLSRYRVARPIPLPSLDAALARTACSLFAAPEQSCLFPVWKARWRWLDANVGQRAHRRQALPYSGGSGQCHCLVVYAALARLRIKPLRFDPLG